MSDPASGALRFVIAAVVAITAACSGVPRSTGDGPEADRRVAAVLSGPMLGYATHREVAVWIETDGPAAVEASYWDVETPHQRMRVSAEHVESTSDHTHMLRFVRLAPGRVYGYQILVDGAAAPVAAPARFQTQTLWRWTRTPPAEPEPPTVRIAFGSCAYVNDPPYDRAGAPYGDAYEIFDAVADTDPDFMLWLGDNVYLRDADWSSREAMSYRYEHDRALAELQRLLAATHHYATWDDHDFGTNDADRSFAFAGASLELFRAYWANPTYGTAASPGTFTRFTWADVEVFLLDDRTYRAANDAPDGPDKDYLGDAQLAWLLDGLTSSTATFKLVVNGNQVLNDYNLYEGYQDYEHERRRLLTAIAERGVEGVVFLTGDRHHGELLRVDRPGDYPLYEFTSSPMTGGLGDPVGELDNPLRVPDTLVAGVRNFATIDVAGGWGDRTLQFAARDTRGAVLWQVEVHESELRSPPARASTSATECGRHGCEVAAR